MPFELPSRDNHPRPFFSVSRPRTINARAIKRRTYIPGTEATLGYKLSAAVIIVAIITMHIDSHE